MTERGYRGINQMSVSLIRVVVRDSQNILSWRGPTRINESSC